MDIHADSGIYDEGPATYWNYVPGMYNVPLTTLYSANIDNLVFAGRNTSCTRVANSSIRVMATCAVGGQAIGTAVSLCVKKNCSLKELRVNHMGELQNLLLQNDQTIMGYKEDCKLQNLKITSSSAKIVENTKFTHLKGLEKALMFVIPVQTTHFESVEIGVKNTGIATELRYSVLTGKYKECYMPDETVLESSVLVEKDFDGYVKLPCNTDNIVDDKVYIILWENKQLQIHMTEEDLTGVPTFVVWEKEPNIHDMRKYGQHRVRENICFKNLQPSQNLYDVENIVKGYNRPYGLPNLFITPKNDAFITLEFDEIKATEVQLVFNTDLAEDIIKQQAKTTIKDYKIIFEGSNNKQEILVADNYKRINYFVPQFAISKITIIPLENYGAENFELFGIKVY